MRTSGCTRPSKLRLPESTAQAVRSPAFTAAEISGFSGPRVADAVVHTDAPATKACRAFTERSNTAACPAARRSDHLEREGRQRHGILLEAVPFRAARPPRAVSARANQSRTPSLLEELERARGSAAARDAAAEAARLGCRQAREAVMSLEQRVVREHRRLMLRELSGGELAGVRREGQCGESGAVPRADRPSTAAAD